jgi:small redox-active disulfide protein 2
MKNIKVLGSGCSNCQTTYRLIEEAAQAKGVEVEIEKIEDLSQIMSYGVMSTPGVIVDGALVHAGGLPSKEAIEGWLGEQASGGCCSGSSGSSCC